ncbi:ribonuclease P protein component [bacterium]|nr:ribonuclease P protein component [bacterium]
MAGSQTFPKRERLQRGSEFRRVFDNGRKVVGRLAVLYVRPGGSGGPACRLGLVTSRKVGDAVDRNRARRLLREAYRRHKNELQPSLELVIIARPAINGRSYADVETEMIGLFARANMLTT